MIRHWLSGLGTAKENFPWESGLSAKVLGFSESVRAQAGVAMKASAFGRLVAMYLAEAALGKTMIGDRIKRLEVFTRTASKYSKLALETMDFEVQVIGHDPDLMEEKNFLMVGNHMSYLDAMITASVQPSVFVTSVDMGEVFFLGTMAELGASIFIERRHRGQVDQDLSVMAEALRDGFNVMIYPEGTSTNGQDILPFKKSLLMSAVEAGRDLMPVCLKYVEIDGEPFGPQNADKVCWYGDMSFAPHLLGLMRLKSVKAELHFLDPIPVTRDSTRQELAEKAYQTIRAVYHNQSQPRPSLTAKLA